MGVAAVGEVATSLPPRRERVRIILRVMPRHRRDHPAHVDGLDSEPSHPPPRMVRQAVDDPLRIGTGGFDRREDAGEQVGAGVRSFRHQPVHRHDSGPNPNTSATASAGQGDVNDGISHRSKNAVWSPGSSCANALWASR